MVKGENKKRVKVLLQYQKEYPAEAFAVVINQLVDAGIMKEGEKVSFDFPVPLQKAAADGIDISDLKNLVKILNIKITGEPEQVLYTYKIITETQELEIPVTALEVFSLKYY